MSCVRNMTRQLMWVSLVTAFAVGMAGMGCSSAKKKDEPDSLNADTNFSGDSDSGRAGGLQTIHFEYDSYTLTDSAKSQLQNNAGILKGNGKMNIQIEGHCDERGGIQYNLALGEKRANSVKKYLSDKGIANDRLTTISFGKERPLDPASTEAAWNRNRRANFVVTSR